MGFSGKRKTGGNKKGKSAPRTSKKAVSSKAAKKPAAPKKGLKGKGGHFLAAMPYLRDFFENNPAMKLIVDAHSGQIVMANHTARDFYGYSPEEFSGINVEHLNVMSKQKTRAGLDMLRAKKKFHFFRQHRTKGGAIKNVEIFTTPIKLNGHLYFVSVLHDITRLVETESNLRRSEKKYRAVLENAADAMFMHDNKGAILDVNQQACASLGYSRGELLGMTIFDIKDTFDKTALIDAWSGMADGEARTFHGAHRKKDGRIFSVEVAVRMFTSRNRRLFIAIARDISARKEMEKDLARTRELLQGVMDNTLTHIWIKDAQGRYLMVNRQWEKEINVPSDAAMGKTDYDIFSPGVAEKLRANDQSVMAARRPLTLEETVERNGGRRFFITVKFPLLDSSGEIFAVGGVGTEITAIKEAEELMRAHQAEMEMQNEELRRTREELEVSRAKYFDLYNLAPVGYFSISERGVIVEANLTAATLLGMERSALPGQPFTKFIIPGDQDAHYRLKKQLFKTGKPQTCEVRMARQDGALFWARLEAAVDGDAESGSPVYHAVIIDINESRMAEDALRESEAKYSAIMHGANDAILLADVEGNFVDANPQGLHLLGYTREEFLKMNIRQIHPPERLERAMESFNTMLREGYSSRSDAALLRKDGSHAHVDVTGSLIEYNGRKLALGIFRDITERKRADLRMRLLQNAINQADETVIVTDADGAIEYANPAAERKSGYSLSALLGKNPRIFKSGFQNHAFYERLWRTIKSGHIWRGNIVNRRADGSHREEEVTISPVLGTDGVITHFVAIRRDINDQKLLRERLIHAEKLSSLGTFVAGVAHELNNPLTAVIGFSNDLRQRTDLSEDLRHTLAIIADQSKRAVGVVKNLLSYSRPHKAERRTLDMNKLLENTIGIHRYRLRADNIPVETEFAPDPLPVYADAGQIQQVVVNILLNAQAAIKTAGVGGAIRVAARRESEWGEDLAVITISNSGPPIPPENIDRIFDPYFTTKGAGEGTGLGLYVAHSIVADHHGELRAENLPEGGVAFHLTLPIGVGERAAAAPVPQTGKIPPGSKVLVVDDEAPVRDWLTGMLLRHKVFAAGAASVNEAIRYLENGRFDAVVSDYKMPEKDGIDLYGWLAERRPETAKHFMFLTGAVEPRLMEFCEGRNLTALIKPVDEEAVIAAIAQLLAKGAE